MRIKESELVLGTFYSTHPGINMFRSIWGIEDRFLESYFGKLSVTTEARVVSSSGLYVYEWQFLPVKYISENIDLDASYYYMYLPDGMLPLSTRIYVEYMGKNYTSIRNGQSFSFVDRLGRIALQMPRALIQIDRTSIDFMDKECDGLWFADYVKDENVIESHFGNILGLMINRDLYITLKSTNPADRYYYPGPRVLDVNYNYNKMMREIVTTMMVKHPSPNNIKAVAKSIVKNYGFRDESSVVVSDRVNSNWSSINVHSLAVVSADILDPSSGKSAGQKIESKLFAALSKIMAYFKPIFTRMILSTMDRPNIMDNFGLNDHIDHEKTSMNMSLYDTLTVVRPTMTDGFKIIGEQATSSFKDSTDYRLDKNYQIGGKHA